MRCAIPALALLLASATSACTVGATGFATDFNGSQESTQEASIRASTSEALVGPDGKCEADINIDPSLLRPLGPGGIPPLGSTECEVVARLGGPYQVEINDGAQGQRLTRLTYVSGPRLAVYDFTDNRLTKVEH